jgi:hypothetical protein
MRAVIRSRYRLAMKLDSVPTLLERAAAAFWKSLEARKAGTTGAGAEEEARLRSGLPGSQTSRLTSLLSGRRTQELLKDPVSDSHALLPSVLVGEPEVNPLIDAHVDGILLQV